MPYVKLPVIKTPQDHISIWRYMDLPKFLLMLEQGALYFALLSEFEDKWEAVLDRQLRLSIANTYSTASGGVVRTYEAFGQSIAVNCWYCGTGESVAMWRLYTSSEYGVAIRSSVGHLKQALAAVEETVYLGRVAYRDHTDPPSPVLAEGQMTPFRAVLQKRRCYEHENELRALALVPQLETPPSSRRGKLIKVALATLIQSITTGPNFPAWAWQLIESGLLRAELQIPITESNAFKPPDPEFLSD